MSGQSNVGSTWTNVERVRLAVVGVWLLVVVVAALAALAASGCVETADCNATVRCPEAEVCYEYECRPICESAEQCSASQQCAPCMPEGSSDEQGRCFGRNVNACIEESS